MSEYARKKLFKSTTLQHGMEGIRGTHMPFRGPRPSLPQWGPTPNGGRGRGRPVGLGGGGWGGRLEPGIWPLGWGMAAISDFGSEWGIVENTLSWPTECPMFSHCVQFRKTVCVPSQLVLMAWGRE